MQRSGSMPQSAKACEPVDASLRSLSDTQPVQRSSSNCLGGKYTFQKKIELYKGSVSTVYKCLVAGGAPVVVKTYHKGKMVEKHFHKLEREVSAMRAMSRKVGKRGIVELLDTYEDANSVYLVMECCEGGDLFKRLMLHGGKLPEHWVCVQVIAPLLRVLARMHELHIMHRDIKPENIFLTTEGEVKLGDFGLAIEWTRELPFSRSGTLDYMAPEVLMNPATHTQESTAVTPSLLASKGIRPYTSAVDVWAAGCLAYELVCGRPPFEVEDEKQTASLIIHSHTIAFDPPGTASWASFVTEALVKDPKKRPDATELLEHPWIRSNLERAEREAACSRMPAAAPPMHRDAGRAPAVVAASEVAAASGPGLAKAAPVSSAGGSSVASASDCGCSSGGGSSCMSGSSTGGASYSSRTSNNGSSSSTIGGASAGSNGTSISAHQYPGTPSAAMQAILTAATNLAVRVSSGQQQQQPQQQQQGPMTPPPAGSAASASASNAAAYLGTASVPAQQRASSNSSRPRVSNQGTSGTALRSLLDSFKSASINGNGSGTAANMERRVPTATGAVRPPSAGSILASPPAPSTAAPSTLPVMGWRTPPASPTRERCASGGTLQGEQPQLLPCHGGLSPQRVAAFSACAGSNPANAVAGGSLSPSRMPRIGAASTGGMATPGGSGSSGGGNSVLSGLVRPVTSISTAGGYMSGLEGPTSLTSPSGHTATKPPRPRSESPIQLVAAAAAAVSASSNTYQSSPLRNTTHPASPPRGKPSVSPPRHGWGQGLPAASTLQELARNWGAVVQITVNKPVGSTGTGVSNSNGNIALSGGDSAFASPQRPAGKGLDAYGLPPATPVASALPASEYCSPRPAGVLERVKYHLRGGGPVTPSTAGQQPAVHAGQHQ